MLNLRKRVHGLLADESGVSSIEYALLLAFIAGAIIASAAELANAVADQIQDTATCITTAGGSC